MYRCPSRTQFLLGAVSDTAALACWDLARTAGLATGLKWAIMAFATLYNFVQLRSQQLG
jgi:hypothetical protein